MFKQLVLKWKITADVNSAKPTSLILKSSSPLRGINTHQVYNHKSWWEPLLQQTNKSQAPCHGWEMVQTVCTCQQRMNGSVLKGEKMTRRRPGLPAVCRCLPSDKSEASGEARERGGTWRWRGRQSHSLCVIWENLQINTNNSLVLWAPPPHPISPSSSLSSPPVPPCSLPHSLTHFLSITGPSLYGLIQTLVRRGRRAVVRGNKSRKDGRKMRKLKSEIPEIIKKIKLDAEMRKVGCRKYVSWHLGGWGRQVGGMITLPSTGGHYDSAMGGYISTVASLWGILWQISVSVSEASKCMEEAQGCEWSCDILHIQGSGFFPEPCHFINTQNWNLLIKKWHSFRFVIPEMLCCSGRNAGLWLSFMTESWLIYECSFSPIKHDVVQQRDCAHIGLFDSSQAFNPNLNSPFRLKFQLGNNFLRPCTPVTFNICTPGASFPDVLIWIASLSLCLSSIACVSLLEEGSVLCALLEVF